MLPKNKPNKQKEKERNRKKQRFINLMRMWKNIK